MGSQTDLILIDTNVFVIDLRYKRDANYASNRAFLETVAQRNTGFTTLVNLLELCGILSFNLNGRQLLDLLQYFPARYNVTVLPEADLSTDFPGFALRGLFEQLQKKTSFGDALLLALAEKFLPFVTTLATWDKDHFDNKFSGSVLTPAQYMADLG